MQTEFKIADKGLFPNLTGVYAFSFTNSKQKKFYVGSASKHIRQNGCNLGFNYRWKIHIRELRLNKSHSIKLQRAYNKYGEENMLIQILEFVEPEKCIEREQFFIDQFNSCKRGYNICPKAGNTLGLKKTKAQRESSKNLTIRTGKDSGNSHEIYQYSCDGNFIKKWDCISEAERFLGKHIDNINEKNKKNGTILGFIWLREFAGEKIEPRKRNIKPTQRKRVAMLSIEDGSIIKEFDSYTEAGLFFGKKTGGSLGPALKDSLKTAYGYKWKYL